METRLYEINIMILIHFHMSCMLLKVNSIPYIMN